MAATHNVCKFKDEHKNIHDCLLYIVRFDVIFREKWKKKDRHRHRETGANMRVWAKEFPTISVVKRLQKKNLFAKHKMMAITVFFIQLAIKETMKKNRNKQISTMYVAVVFAAQLKHTSHAYSHSQTHLLWCDGAIVTRHTRSISNYRWQIYTETLVYCDIYRVELFFWLFILIKDFISLVFSFSLISRMKFALNFAQFNPLFYPIFVTYYLGFFSY